MSKRNPITFSKFDGKASSGNNYGCDILRNSERIGMIEVFLACEDRGITEKYYTVEAYEVTFFDDEHDAKARLFEAKAHGGARSALSAAKAYARAAA